jgi:hypothetical protein
LEVGSASIRNCAAFNTAIITMKPLFVSALLFLQAVPINAFEFSFKLPFSLNFSFRKEVSPELFLLHKSLIEFPSVTGEEHDVGVFLAQYLERLNYTVERIPGLRIPQKLC